MQIEFPSALEHGVSLESGFLPARPPLKWLPSIYEPWDTLAGRLSRLISSKGLRSEVQQLSILSASHLSSREELHRAFVVLGFLVHGYVWCDGSDHPEPNVPPQLAEPYLEVCERLGMQPTLAYAGLCLWNWQIRDCPELNGVNGESKHGLSRLDALDCLVSFTDTRDEAVFYLIPVMVEAEGGRLVSLLLEAMREAAHNGHSEAIIEALEETRNTLPKMSALMKYLHEQCDAKVFYQQIRPFFPGARGMEEKGMPDGVVFHRSDGKKVRAKCVGGSAAQSSLFQFIDSALGVRHKPVGLDEGQTVFQEMWSYMPLEHRTFLDKVGNLPSLRKYVEVRPDDQRLTDAYNACLQQLSTWRSRHIGVITTHIVNQSRNSQPPARKQDPEKVTEGLSVRDESNLQGTGGSALIPFLKQAKQETLDARTRK